MKFAVAGASGFVGSALVRRLEAEGHEVLRLVRRPVERPGEIAWHPLSGEVEQRELLEGAEGLVNLSGCNLAAGRWTPERKEEILRSRVESTRTLVTVLAHLNHKPRVFLSASAVGYYGSRGEEELTETSAKGEGFLADVCRTWEEEARIAESVCSMSFWDVEACALDWCWAATVGSSRNCCRCFAADWAVDLGTGGNG